MEGLNKVIMRGYIAYPKLQVSQNGRTHFSGKIVVPVEYVSGGEKKSTKLYYNISSWSSGIAEALAELITNTPVEITGHLNVRPYDGTCTSCNAPQKKYWTEVEVENFVIATDDLES